MEQQLTLNFMLPFIYLLILSKVSLVISYPSINHHQQQSPVNTHAILIAGTSGWINYRHQANIAHGYQILRSHGIPKENIIVMSTDDIAHNEKNPIKGKLFNSPHGNDVYSGLKIDYSGNQVTPINFLNILNGSSSLELPKVLKSNSNDNVFIYISSLGSTGLISFPNDILTSKSFNEALINLKINQKFSHLTVYLDTDYSGSMFDSMLPENISVYSLSSASANQLNVACYCNNQLIPSTCLANSFSSAWLSYSGSKFSLSNVTLSQQFQAIVRSIGHSQSKPLTPRQYGDLSLVHLPIGQFMGSNESIKVEQLSTIRDQLSTIDVPLEMLKVTSKEESLLEIINLRRSFDRAFYRLIDDLCWAGYCSNVTHILSSSSRLLNHDIYHLIVTKFHTDCLNIARGSYAMVKMYAFANIINESESKLSQQLDKFLPSMYQACRRHIINHRFENII
ncbi:hemoglobinase-like [Panonychus citri]|uniref:hemoglobinase-like n=1 Tax=Panonychus citri TaxID=50023 RepID=UPI0023080B3F|nr:hemoglobinase-like [Panonychus citri]